MRLFEMFAGYGGLSTAIENVLGATTTAVAEIEPGPSRILAHHYPHAPNLGDVTRANWADAGKVHVIGGGSPCQDISGAGPRTGMLHGNRSGLWASMRDAIAYHRPTYVVWENVRAATSAKASSANDPNGTLGNLRALGRVLGDLAELGYNAEWTLARASDIGACHQRARIFLLAWQRTAGDITHEGITAYAHWNPALDAFTTTTEIYRAKLPASGSLHNAALYPRAHRSNTPPRTPQLLPTPKATDGKYATPRTSGRPVERATHLVTRASYQLSTANGFTLLPTPRTSDTNGGGTRGKGGPDLRTVTSRPLSRANGFRLLPTPGANLGTNGGAQHPAKRRGGGHTVSLEDITAFLPDTAAWGAYLPGIIHHASTLGMYDVPDPTIPGHREGSRRRLNPAFAEWMMGIPAGHVTNPELGLTRAQQLTAIGNGVMTQQAQWALADLYQRAQLQVPEDAQLALWV